MYLVIKQPDSKTGFWQSYNYENDDDVLVHLYQFITRHYTPVRDSSLFMTGKLFTGEHQLKWEAVFNFPTIFEDEVNF